MLTWGCTSTPSSIGSTAPALHKIVVAAAASSSPLQSLGPRRGGAVVVAFEPLLLPPIPHLPTYCAVVCCTADGVPALQCHASMQDGCPSLPVSMMPDVIHPRSARTTALPFRRFCQRLKILRCSGQSSGRRSRRNSLRAECRFISGGGDGETCTVSTDRSCCLVKMQSGHTVHVPTVLVLTTVFYAGRAEHN